MQMIYENKNECARTMYIGKPKPKKSDLNLPVSASLQILSPSLCQAGIDFPFIHGLDASAINPRKTCRSAKDFSKISTP